MKTEQKHKKWYSFDIYILHDLKTLYIYKQMGGANLVKPHPLNIRWQLSLTNQIITNNLQIIFETKRYSSILLTEIICLKTSDITSCVQIHKHFLHNSSTTVHTGIKI